MNTFDKDVQQIALVTFDLGLNSPLGHLLSASSSLENVLQISAQQTEEMKCSQRGKALEV